jgi:hypothetical protein
MRNIWLDRVIVMGLEESLSTMERPSHIIKRQLRQETHAGKMHWESVMKMEKGAIEILEPHAPYTKNPPKLEILMGRTIWVYVTSMEEE